MGKEKKLLVRAPADQLPPPSPIQILRDGSELLTRSWKPVLSILLLFLVPFAFIFVGDNLAVTPLTEDMAAKFMAMSSTDPRSPEFRVLLAAVMRDLRGITGAESATIICSNLLSLLLVLAVVRAVAAAVDRGVPVAAGDRLPGVGRTWRGAVLAGLYVLLLRTGYSTLLFLLVALPVFVSGGSAAVVVACVVLAALAVLLLVYLQVVWYLGLVVSVVEEDRSGLAALGRASELIRGRRKLGFTVNLLLVLLTAVLFAVFYIAVVSLSLTHGGGTVLQLASGFFAVCCSLVITAFMAAVYVAFYYECRRSRAPEDGGAGGGRLVYTKAETAEPSDLESSL